MNEETQVDSPLQNEGLTADVEVQDEKSYTQKDLDEAVQKRAWRAERKAEKRIEALRTEFEAKITQSKPVASVSDDAPKREAFDTYEDYIEARADYRADQKVNKRFEEQEGKQAKKSEELKAKDTEKKFQEQSLKRVEDGRKEYSDFDTVVNEAFEDDIIPAGSELHYGIIDSDVGHKIAYYLGKNKAEAERLLDLSPRALSRELGKLEDRLAAKKPKADVMDPIDGRKSLNSGVRDGMSMDAFIRAREK